MLRRILVSIVLSCIVAVLSSNIVAGQSNVTNNPPTNAPVNQVRVYEIGLRGPAGGIVFHISDGGRNRFSGYHGLEVAPSIIGSASWGCENEMLTGANGWKLGTGRQNTKAIINECTENDSAASLAVNYSLNGFKDWYLPSVAELRIIHANVYMLGLLPENAYPLWSSTQTSNDIAKIFLMIYANERIEEADKKDFYTVLPIRSF